MLTMKADKWIFPLAVCFMCVSSNDEKHYDKPCDTHKLSVALGSSVLLPCNLTTSNLSWVSWVHIPDVDLVHLTSEGRIKFLLPKRGRVKAFPNQGSKGNFSICIDELEDSDLGCYRCMQGNNCVQVDLVAAPADDSGTLTQEMWLLICVCIGMTALILLSVCSCLVYYYRTKDNTNNLIEADIVGASAPPAETGRVPVHERQRGADNNNLVYENDDQDPANLQGNPTRNRRSPPGVPHNLDQTQPTEGTSTIYPNLNQLPFERVQSQRTKQRFHRELFSRLRQASLGRHYYVNQGELIRQQAMSAQAGNHHRDAEYKNPIYNRSTDQLNHL